MMREEAKHGISVPYSRGVAAVARSLLWIRQYDDGYDNALGKVLTRSQKRTRLKLQYTRWLYEEMEK